MTREMTGAEMVVEALRDQGVSTLFGYPGGAVLPIYDALFNQNAVRHILVRHEQGAAHAAEGYARSSGKVGVLLVTSGPGATNVVTGLTDALLDSIPLVCITGQVPTHLIGSDAFQECDTVGITRHCTKHNYLVRRIEDLPRILHEAFSVAGHRAPRPGRDRHPQGRAVRHREPTPGPSNIQHKTYRPKTEGRRGSTRSASRAGVARLGQEADLLHRWRGHQLRPGGRRRCCATSPRVTGVPVTSTLMGLGAFPASPTRSGSGCSACTAPTSPTTRCTTAIVMIAIGARFDDRITGRLDAFSPNSTQGAHRHRPLLDQQGRSRPRSASSAIAPTSSRTWSGIWRGEAHDGSDRSRRWRIGGAPSIGRWRERKSLAFRPSAHGRSSRSTPSSGSTN